MNDSVPSESSDGTRGDALEQIVSPSACAMRARPELWRILDICATVPIQFVIADGIEAMEGNGPLNGLRRQLGRIVLSDDPVDADATCARLMGLNPELVHHLAAGRRFLGNLDEGRITMIAENIPRNIVSFRVLPTFRSFHNNRGGSLGKIVLRVREILSSLEDHRAKTVCSGSVRV